MLYGLIKPYGLKHVHELKMHPVYFWIVNCDCKIVFVPELIEDSRITKISTTESSSRNRTSVIVSS